MSPASGDKYGIIKVKTKNWVSIQLMSPASGDYRDKTLTISNMNGVSIQLMSPASGDKLRWVCQKRGHVSIQLMSPASGDSSSDRPVLQKAS